MRAGALDKRVTIQTKTITYDSYHAPIETWADTVTVWAGIETTGGGEFYAAQKINANTEMLITIRYRTIAKTQRIKYGTRYFEILNINNVGERDREIQLSVKEVV